MTVYKGIDIKQLQIRIEIKKNRDKIGCLENKIWTFMNVCYAPAPVGPGASGFPTTPCSAAG